MKPSLERIEKLAVFERQVHHNDYAQQPDGEPSFFRAEIGQRETPGAFQEGL